ncbi:MAG: hypothetical protein KBE50_03920 [Fervidobacterium sp.]|nr:hypothetical protein [Fervidobacterium sp.]
MSADLPHPIPSNSPTLLRFGFPNVKKHISGLTKNGMTSKTVICFANNRNLTADLL